MSTKYSVKFNGKTYFYVSLEEATKFCKFCGIPVSSIKVVDLY